jgi:hypothetical protein
MIAMKPLTIADVVKIMGINTGKKLISRKGFVTVFSYIGTKLREHPLLSIFYIKGET